MSRWPEIVCQFAPSWIWAQRLLQVAIALSHEPANRFTENDSNLRPNEVIRPDDVALAPEQEMAPRQESYASGRGGRSVCEFEP